MASVNGMIQDVMEVGSDSKPICEPTNPEALIETTTNEIFRVYPESDVTISYDLQHAHKVSVDTLKVARVFSNIVGNAVQAMNYRGEIWFRTRETKCGSFVEFCLGNAGSFIPPESLPKLFEAFFTSEKKGGTGLGLAIAQKIVQAHGGRIWCESVRDAQHSQGKVEFFFTLPTDKTCADSGGVRLPRSSREVAQALEEFRLQAVQSGSAVTDEQEARLERELLGKLKVHSSPLPLLIVDDEAVYRNALASLIARSEELSAKFLIRFGSHAAEGVRLAETEQPFLVILDVDLGTGSANGMDAARAMRAKGFRGRVCIHSNRFLANDYRAALEAGADTVVPKPISRALFLKVIIEALEQRAVEAGVQPAPATRKPEVVFIDDNDIFRMGWEMKLKRDTVFHEFDGARSFWQHLEREPDFLSRLSCVITDYHFAPDDVETGVQLGTKLKARGFAKPILLASDGEFKLDEVRNGVDHIVPKDTLTWAEIRTIVEKVTMQSNKRET